MGKINSRQKGAAYEREVANALSALLGLNVQRAARIGVEGGEDIMGWPGVNPECKRYKRISVMKWLQQSIDDVERDGDGDIPIVVMREDRGESVVMVRLEDLERFACNFLKTRMNGRDGTRVTERFWGGY